MERRRRRVHGCRGRHRVTHPCIANHLAGKPRRGARALLSVRECATISPPRSSSSPPSPAPARASSLRTMRGPTRLRRAIAVQGSGHPNARRRCPSSKRRARRTGSSANTATTTIRSATPWLCARPAGGPRRSTSEVGRRSAPRSRPPFRRIRPTARQRRTRCPRARAPARARATTTARAARAESTARTTPFGNATAIRTRE